MIFGGDMFRVCKDNAAYNLALLRRLVLGQLKRYTTLNAGIQIKHHHTMPAFFSRYASCARVRPRLRAASATL